MADSSVWFTEGSSSLKNSVPISISMKKIVKPRSSCHCNWRIKLHQLKIQSNAFDFLREVEHNHNINKGSRRDKFCDRLTLE